VTCVHCESDDVVKRGTTGKDAQQYWCKHCETYFNDLTTTIFGQHRFGLEEMFYIVKEMRSEPTAQIARDLDRDSVPHKASSASCFCGLSSVSKRLY